MNIALQSFNFPDRFIRHANFLGELTPVTTDLDRQDASFRLVDGLADLRLMAFASHNFGNHVLRHENFRVMLHDRTHRVALASVASCNRLTGEEKLRLIDAYRRNIHHRISNEAGVNASATIGGSTISVNFSVLFPQGDEEISQTLIHEMMHCAGFTHPPRRSPPAGRSCADPDPSSFDCPDDNGQYYGTPPLRAEFCIAGDQSDLRRRAGRKAASERCVIDAAGVATLHVD